MGEVIEENDLARHIRYHHTISDAAWDSGANLWTVDVTNTATGKSRRFTSNFLWMCRATITTPSPTRPSGQA